MGLRIVSPHSRQVLAGGGGLCPTQPATAGGAPSRQRPGQAAGRAAASEREGARLQHPGGSGGPHS